MPDQPVAFFDIDQRQCHLKDGRTLPITNLFDHDGDEIHGKFEWEELYSFVAGEGDYWVTVFMDSFEPVTLN